MSKDQEQDFLYQGRILRLATSGSTLHLVPIWYVYQNGKIYVHTGAGSIKVKDINENSEVAMCVDVGEFYYDLKNVKMLGRARILRDEGLARAIAENILVKYLGSSSHPQAKKYLSNKSKNVVIEIEILKTYSEDYSQMK
ncbi:MAG: pyridoxamine 5'-phosphate oxidase family protein [Rhabdochlamydiaceae bacterium]